MEGASSRAETRTLTGPCGNAVLAASEASFSGSRKRFVDRQRDSSRQGASEVDAHSSPAEDNAAERGASLRGLADIGAHQDSGTPAAAVAGEA